MKRCPQCKQFFTEEDVFCLNDGTVLETVGPAANDAPTQVVSSPFARNKTKAAGKNNFYWIIGLMALIIVFLLGGVFVLLLRPMTQQATVQTTETSGDRSDSQIAAPGAKPQNSAPAMPNPAAVLDQQPYLPQITKEAVEELIGRWEKAQDIQNFRAYQECYGQPFLGIKRTKSGHVSRMNYSQWMNDRRKMLSQAVALDVGVEGLRITIEGDTASAEFEQSYRSIKYSDRGTKILKVKMFPDGAKIIYEDLKDSY